MHLGTSLKIFWAIRVLSLVEEWVTLADHDKYVSWRTDQGDLDETGDLLDGGIENGLAVYEWGAKTDI